MVTKEELGESAAMYVVGARIGGTYISQVIGLIVGGMIGYSYAYFGIAIVFLLFSAFIFFKMPEPERNARPFISVFSEPRKWFKDSFVDPFIDLKERYSSGLTLLLLLLFFYRLSCLIYIVIDFTKPLFLL